MASTSASPCTTSSCPRRWARTAARIGDYGGLSQGQGFENVGEKTYIWYGQMDRAYGCSRRDALEATPGNRPAAAGPGPLPGSLSVRDPDRYPGDRRIFSWMGMILRKATLLGQCRGSGSSIQVEGGVAGPHGFLTPAKLLGSQLLPWCPVSSGLRIPVNWKSGEQIQGLERVFQDPDHPARG